MGRRRWGCSRGQGSSSRAEGEGWSCKNGPQSALQRPKLIDAVPEPECEVAIATQLMRYSTTPRLHKQKAWLALPGSDPVQNEHARTL